MARDAECDSLKLLKVKIQTFSNAAQSHVFAESSVNSTFLPPVELHLSFSDRFLKYLEASTPSNDTSTRTVEMARSLDKLVEFLLDQIALYAKQGIPKSKVDRLIREYLGLSAPKDVAAASDSPDQRLLDRAWSWLKAHPEIWIREHSLPQSSGKSIDAGTDAQSQDQDLGSAPLSEEPRVFTSHYTTWKSLTGHEPDWTRCPKFEFECLCVIAQSGPDGILQADVTKATGQDKRSVPPRTNSLEEKGYIEKRAVFVRGQKTSLLRLARYRSSTDEPADAGASASTAAEQGVEGIFGSDGVIDVERLLRELFGILRQSDITTYAELKVKMGVAGKYRKTHRFNRVIRKLQAMGCVRRIDAVGENEKGRWRCIKLIREPEDQEWTMARDSADDDQDEAGEDPSFDEPLVETNLQWSPDKPYINTLFNIILSSGKSGITTLDLRGCTVGDFFTRPVDTLMQRHTEYWETSQPPFLQHLTMIKDRASVGKASHHLFITRTNFAALVEEGETEWAAIEGGHTAKKATKVKQQPVVNHHIADSCDSYGFANFQNAAFGPANGDVFQNNTIPGFNSLRNARTEYVISVDEQGKYRLEWTRAPGRHPDPASPLPEGEDSLPKKKLGRPKGSKARPNGPKGPRGRPPKKKRKTNQTKSSTAVVPVGDEETGEEAVRSKIVTFSSEKLKNFKLSDKLATFNSISTLNPISHTPTEKEGTITKSHAEVSSQQNSSAKPSMFPTTAREGAVTRKRRRNDDSAQDTQTKRTRQASLPTSEDLECQIQRQIASDNPIPTLTAPPILATSTASALVPTVSASTVSPPAALVQTEHVSTAQTQTDPILSTPVQGEPSSVIATLVEPSLVAPSLPVSSTISPYHVSPDNQEPDTHQGQPEQTSTHIEERPETPSLQQQNINDVSNPLPDLVLQDAPVEANQEGQHKLAQSRGTALFKRKRAIMNIIERNDGVFTGDKDLYYAWCLEMQLTEPSNITNGVPDFKTYKTAERTLTGSGQLKILKFVFMTPAGKMMTRTILAAARVNSQSHAVRKLQKAIIDRGGTVQIPTELSVMSSYHNTFLRKHISDAQIGHVERQSVATLLPHLTQPLPKRASPVTKINRTLTPSERSDKSIVAGVIVPHTTRPPQDTVQRVNRTPTSARPRSELYLLPRAPLHVPSSASKVPLIETSRVRKPTQIIRTQNSTYTHDPRYLHTRVQAIFHQSSGTFGTKLRNTVRRLYYHRQFPNTYEKKPQSLDHILWRSKRIQRGLQEKGKVLTFEQELAEVEKWERYVTNKHVRVEEKSGFNFIVHSYGPRTPLQDSSSLYPTISFANEACDVRATCDEHQHSQDSQVLQEETASQLRNFASQNGIQGCRVSQSQSQSKPKTAYQSRDKDHGQSAPSKISRSAKTFKTRHLLSHEGCDDLSDDQRTPSSLEDGEDDFALIGTTQKQPRFSNMLQTLTSEVIERLIASVVVIRTVVGGLERSADWVLVSRLFPSYSVDFVSRQWSRNYQKHKTRIEQMQLDFCERFLKAYAADEIPRVDYDNLEGYDWQNLVDWAMGSADPTTRGRLALPPSRTDLQLRFKLIEDGHEKSAIDDYYFIGCTIIRRNKIATDHTIRINAFPEVSDSQHDVAKSWVRANIVTSREKYKALDAEGKLMQIGRPTLNKVVKELVEEKTISHVNRGREVPGRAYQLTDKFWDALKRPLPESFLMESLAYSKQFWDDLNTHGSLTFSPHSTDAQAFIMLNMVADQQIEPVAENAPISRFGLTGSGYKTRQMEKALLNFDVVFRPGQNWEQQDPLPEPPPAPGYSSADADSTVGIPLWYDIHGSFLSSMWDKVANIVLFTVALRPSITATELARISSPALAMWEIEMLLEWFARQAFVMKLGSGWTVTKGRWYAAASRPMWADS